jgi:hypothetical protein
MYPETRDLQQKLPRGRPDGTGRFFQRSRSFSCLNQSQKPNLNLKMMTRGMGNGRQASKAYGSAYLPPFGPERAGAGARISCRPSRPTLTPTNVANGYAE